MELKSAVEKACTDNQVSIRCMAEATGIFNLEEVVRGEVPFTHDMAQALFAVCGPSTDYWAYWIS